MALTVDHHLGVVREELFKARTKWYDIGLALKVPVNTLDSIKLDVQFGDHSDKLRETLKVWLKTAAEPSWQDVVGILKRPVVGEPKLASDIEAKYCTTAETGRDSRRRTHTLEQELLKQNKELTHQVEKKSQQMQSIAKALQQREQTIGELRAAIDELKRQLQQAQQQVQHATEERERQVRELTEQLLGMKQPGPPPQKPAMQRQPLKMPQAGARPRETITPPMQELQQPKKKQHVTGYQQLGPPPQKIVMQQEAIQNMKWKKESKVPEKMYRGSVAADSNWAYFIGGGPTIHSCNSDTQEWRRLPDAPHTQSTLVVVHHILTMVGGRISGRATDSLLSFMNDWRGEKWLPNLPAMPTKRYGTAAVCSGCSLIVAGGSDGTIELATVEVLDTDTQHWSIASSLPHPCTLATISICDERLYMLGGLTRSVLSCSVPELLQSCQPQPTLWQRIRRTAPTNQSTIWQHVADAPHCLSSCTTFCGQLVAVGGYEAGMDTTAISGYNKTTDSWEVMGHMPTARRKALVAIFDGKMMVVGGEVGDWVVGDLVGTATDIVEILC